MMKKVMTERVEQEGDVDEEEGDEEEEEEK